MIDWQEIRKQFPVTEHRAYLNTAAAGPIPRETAAAATRYYDQMMVDGDSHWDEWLEQREAVRRSVANFINAEPDEVGLTTNTSSGMNLIVDALADRGEVISSELEFPVSTIPWMQRHIPVHLVKANDGVVSVANIVEAMTARSGVISLSHVQFSNGLRTDLMKVGKSKGDHAFVVNASQSAGVFPLDVKRMGIDALCATGHKWMLAGYGSGFVYLNRNLLAATKPRAIGWLSVEDPYAMRNSEVHLRHDLAARAELGCPHFAGMFALGASISQMNSIGKENIQNRALSLNRFLTKRLLESHWKILSPLQDESFRSAQTLVASDRPAELTNYLNDRGVSVTEKPQGIRIATNFFNNENDIEQLIEGLNSYSRR